MIYHRSLIPAEVMQGATIIPQSDKPWRQYQNTGGFNALADAASARQEKQALIFNSYAAIADYLVQAVWSQKPEGLDREPLKQFRLSTFYRELYGFGVVAKYDDMLVAVDSRYWWPILVRGVKVGSIIVHPYVDRSVAGASASATTIMPNRAWTLAVFDNAPRAVVRTFEYSGVTLGRQLTQEEISDAQVAVWGDGDMDFAKVQPLVDELDTRLRGNGSILKRFSKPHFQVPVSSITQDAEGNPQITLDEEGSVLPVQRDDKDFKYLTLDVPTALVEFHISHLLNFISALSGVPKAVFAKIDLPRIDSAAGVAAVEQPSTRKIQDWRHDLESAFAFLGYDAMFTDEEGDTNGGQNTNRSPGGDVGVTQGGEGDET